MSRAGSLPQSAPGSQDPKSLTSLLGCGGKERDVFVAEGESAKRRTVQVGSVMGDFVEVISGLGQGDQVITRGGFNLKEGDRISIIQGSGG